MRVSGWYRVIEAALVPPLRILIRHEYRGLGRLPAGGFVLAVNHTSYVDPLVIGLMLHRAGRPPRFLAKAELFDIPVVGRALASAGQIPVDRGTASAREAYTAAVEAVRAGGVVIVYPEATLTRDPELWPMTGRTGAARIAFATGAPVIPAAQWGAHRILPPYATRPRLLPRRTVRVSIGEPVDLADLDPDVHDAAALAEATDRIMDGITGQLERLRGRRAPAHRYDPAADGADGPRDSDDAKEAGA